MSRTRPLVLTGRGFRTSVAAPADDGPPAPPDPSSALHRGLGNRMAQERGEEMRSKLGMYGALMAIGAAAVLAFGATVAAAHGKSRQQTLRLVATDVQENFVDTGAEGPSLGDQLVISVPRARRGRDVGTAGVVCTVTGAEPPYEVLTFQCVATLSLRNGQITLQGL